MLLNAANSERDDPMPHRTPARTSNRQALLLSESGSLLAGPPPLLQALSQSQRETVLSHGRRRVWDGIGGRTATPPARGVVAVTGAGPVRRARRRARARGAPTGRRRDGIGGNVGRSGGPSG